MHPQTDGWMNAQVVTITLHNPANLDNNNNNNKKVAELNDGLLPLAGAMLEFYDEVLCMYIVFLSYVTTILHQRSQPH